MAKIQGARGMNTLVMKYATRPEFMKLMMEVMNDPDMRPVMKNMPGGLGIPAGLPQGAAVSIPASQPPAEAQPSDEDGDGEMTFDPSVISGPAKKAPAAAKKVPVPVDND